MGDHLGHPFPVVFFSAVFTAKNVVRLTHFCGRNALFSGSGSALNGILGQASVHILCDLLPKTGMVTGRFTIFVADRVDQLMQNGILCRLVVRIILQQPIGNRNGAGCLGCGPTLFSMGALVIAPGGPRDCPWGPT